ncbi:hypothetical protein BCR35DRAFT_300751 [Leucosporidium creatinivorum]|uniref:Uncharacterized protein n=1 Tax=Leucosporidium creatinivorum TaxID=106004 RepID=A0A1Y2FY62_9BASI|nr:hypothetical protein BCR35DRAFT_300751 [Leucosporidium creatinivorum]
MRWWRFGTWSMGRRRRILLPPTVSMPSRLPTPSSLLRRTAEPPPDDHRIMPVLGTASATHEGGAEELAPTLPALQHKQRPWIALGEEPERRRWKGVALGGQRCRCCRGSG